MSLLWRLLISIGLAPSGPAVTGISSATQTEGTSLVHTVTLASAVAVMPALYPFNVSAVTASTPSDYTATPTFSAGVTSNGVTLTVPIGVGSFTITVPTSQDTVYEGAETYSVTVGGMSNTGTINDDEAAPTITSVSGISAIEGSPLVHTVAITGTAQAARTYAITLVGGTATGGGTDFTSTLSNGMFSNGVTVSGGNISVPAGVTGFTVTVSTFDDATVEGAETYTLTIGGGSGTGTITDNDFTAPSVSSVSTAAQTEGTSLVHTVTLSTAVTGVSAVYPFSISSVTASTPSDYTATPVFSAGVTLGGGNITVPVGVSSFTATIATSQDTVFEGAETYSVSVNGVTATGTVNDDDAAPTITSVSSASATEGSNIVHTVAITGTAQAARTFAITLSGGTATGGGTDYTSTLTNGAFSAGVTISGGNISVPPGVTGFTVSVPTATDALTEGDETYTLNIGGASGTGTILDSVGLADFYLNLSSPTNATISDAQAVGTLTPSPDFYLNLSSPSNATISDAQAVGTITAGGGSITAAATASRSNGSGNLVAPLAVFFDASSTTSSLTARPFDELEYRWNFGDETSSVWSTGAKAGVALKNEAFGPVAAHVYESAGTFTPTVEIRHGFGSNLVIESYTLPSMTVISADVEFAGTKTVCISATGDFTGAPAGCTQITSSDATAAVAANIGSGNKRILFRRGETFVGTSSIQISQPGPGLVGAFGSGLKPVISNSTGANIFGVSGFDTPTLSDWRILDLQLDSNNIGANSAGLMCYGSVNNLHMSRLDIRNCNSGIKLSISNLDAMNNEALTSPMWDGIFITDNTVFNLLGTGSTGGNAMYLTGWRMAVMGNSIDNNLNGEHGIRSAYSDRSVWQHNVSQNIARAHLTLRSPDQGQSTLAWQLPGITYTQKLLSSDNLFIGGSNPHAFGGTGPTNGQSSGRARDQIWERNLFQGGPGTNGFLEFLGSQITVRNNIAFKDAAGGAFPFSIGAYDEPYATNDGSPQPTGIRWYHNTTFTPTANEFYFSSGGSPVGTAFKNNLVYCPNNIVAQDGRGWLFQYDMAANINSFDILPLSANTLDAEMQTSPNFTVNPPTAAAHVRPLAGSYAIGRGAAVPVWSDYFGVARTSGTDLGAVLS